ncbi:hypothetical protein AGMMS50225_21670 [Betaproteobacteria bacterium]|nr:hypothetical protein AGMMS50225_21670 [Betaproteobacteria bacterium]
MTTQRFLFILFLLCNLLAYAAIQGWLSEAPTVEADRLALQLHPEQVKVLGPPPQASAQAQAVRPPASNNPPPPAATPSATSTVPVALPAAPPPTATERPGRCFLWRNLDPADSARLQTVFKNAGIEYSASERETVSAWWVRIPPQPNREAADRQARELQTQGVHEFFIVREAGPHQWSISLGTFKTEQAARSYLDQLHAQGVKAATLSARSRRENQIEAIAPSTRIESVIAGLNFARNYGVCPGQ